VPTGSTNAYEQLSVMGTMKSNGFTPIAMAISPAIGNIMVAVAELLANSVKKAVNIDMKIIVPLIVPAPILESRSPIKCDNPDS